MAGNDTQDFLRDLATLQTRSEDEALVYKDMPPEGKRKCMDDLENALHVLQKIKKNLKEADDHSPDKKIVQVVWNGQQTLVPTKGDFERYFEEYNSGCKKQAFDNAPRIKSVVMQDNFKLDDKKYLKPTLMCFIQFSNEEDCCIVLGLGGLNLRINNRGFGINVQFIQPTESQATHKTLRIIGNSIARLEEIDKELKKIGVVRDQGGMPKPKAELCDKSRYLTIINEAKATRAAGKSLDHFHGVLASVKPFDLEAFQAVVKPLYDEECDILIQLREYQLGGLDFNFKHPAF